jgi:hypothetical protein
MHRRSTRSVRQLGEGRRAAADTRPTTRSASGPGSHDGKCSQYDWGYQSRVGRSSSTASAASATATAPTFVAWKLGLTWSQFGFKVGEGNATNWRAKAAHAASSRPPRRPSAISRGGGTTKNPAGHVAIVSAGQTLTRA